MWSEGNTLAGHRLIEKIGEGHFGEVWKVSFDGRIFALKIFARPYRVAHLRREALAQYALGQLAYPHSRFFPHVEQIDLQHDPPYVRMELVDGVPLEEVITQPTLGLSERVALGEQILQALAIVHEQGFVHGDLSPMNILVAGRGPDGERLIQLIDVGFGALLDDDGDDMTQSDVAPTGDRPFGVASPLYAAPERFKSEFLNGCGAASDIFSYGKILYRLITGESPYIVKPVTRKFPDLSPAWDEFIYRCLEDRPDDRFSDAVAALAFFRTTVRDAVAPPVGSARTECPECDTKIQLTPAAMGDRIICPSCGISVEILGVDEQTGYADSAVVSIGEPPLEDVTIEEAIKFCPSCGERIRIEAQKCRFCGVWVEEFFRQLQEKTDARVREAGRNRAGQTSYFIPAIITLLGYLVCWLPGVILNLHFLMEASRSEQVLGERPEGATLLHVMIWALVYMPLIVTISIVIFAMLRSLG